MRSIVLCLAVLLIAPNATQADECLVSYGDYGNIWNGMTERQALAALRCPGTIIAETESGSTRIKIVRWAGYGTPGANITVTFQNGRVASKANAGLHLGRTAPDNLQNYSQP